VPLFDVSHGNTPIKYVAMDVEINSKKLRFMVDTGATINLIKKSSLNALGKSNLIMFSWATFSYCYYYVVCPEDESHLIYVMPVDADC
jgi:Aspartyl protease